MKGMFFMAEGASGHPDGSVSILRAFIDEFHADAYPALHKCALVARIDPEGQVGKAPLKISILREGEAEVHDLLDAEVVFSPGKSLAAVIEHTVPFKAPGSFVYAMSVDGLVLAEWRFRAKLRAENTAKATGS